VNAKVQASGGQESVVKCLMSDIVAKLKDS